MTFTITIDVAGHITKDPDAPWQLGEAEKEEHIICLVNNDNTKHVVELVNFTHKGSGKQFKPLKGDRRLRAESGCTDHFTVRTKKNSDDLYGSFLYWIKVDDDVPGFDPEIVVDRPQSFAFKRQKKSSAQTTGAYTKGMKRTKGTKGTKGILRKKGAKGANRGKRAQAQRKR